MFEYIKAKIGSLKPKKDRQYKDKTIYTKIHIKLKIKHSKSTQNLE